MARYLLVYCKLKCDRQFYVVCVKKKAKRKKYNNHLLTVINLSRTDVKTISAFC